MRLTVYCRNIWGPHKQAGIIDVIADCYGISHRFHAILKASPPVKPRGEGSPPAAQRTAITANGLPRNDIEIANGTAEKSPVKRVEHPEELNHYAIAGHLINYQSLDLGEKCMPSDPEHHCHGC